MGMDQQQIECNEFGRIGADVDRILTSIVGGMN
jgi:hypothetical protein